MTDTPTRFDDLHARYAASLARKLEALEAAWRAFRTSPGNDDGRRELETLVHRLAGSAPAYGYEQLGDRARAVDQLMHAWDESAPVLRAAVADFAQRLDVPMQHLLDELARAHDDVVARRDSPREAMRVLLVIEDVEQALLTAAQLEARGCRTRIHPDGADLLTAALEGVFHAIVLDGSVAGGLAGGLASLRSLDRRIAPVALIGWLARRDESALVAAVEAGCDVALARQEGVETLLACLRDVVAQPDRSGMRFG